MTERTSRVMRGLGLTAICLSLSFSTIPVSAQDLALKEEAQEAVDRPIFQVAPLFGDGASRLMTFDGKEFVLQRDGDRALVALPGEDEIQALNISIGRANTEIFQNEIGRTVMVLSDRGNLSLFTPDYPGAPLSFQGEAEAFPPPELDGPDFTGRLSDYLLFRTQQKIDVQLANVARKERGWLQDAARIAGNAIVRAASDSDLAHVSTLRVTRAVYPDATLSKDGVLTIYVSPSEGYYGRPSSGRIEIILKNGIDS